MEKRLGSGKSTMFQTRGIRAIKNHRWFKVGVCCLEWTCRAALQLTSARIQRMDWNKVEAREVVPPIVPSVASMADVSNFAEEFTLAPVVEDSPDARASGTAGFKTNASGAGTGAGTAGAGAAASTQVSEDLFAGFAYTAPDLYEPTAADYDGDMPPPATTTVAPEAHPVKPQPKPATGPANSTPSKKKRRRKKKTTAAAAAAAAAASSSSTAKQCASEPTPAPAAPSPVASVPHTAPNGAGNGTRRPAKAKRLTQAEKAAQARRQAAATSTPAAARPAPPASKTAPATRPAPASSGPRPASTPQQARPQLGDAAKWPSLGGGKPARRVHDAAVPTPSGRGWRGVKAPPSGAARTAAATAAPTSPDAAWGASQWRGAGGAPWGRGSAPAAAPAVPAPAPTPAPPSEPQPRSSPTSLRASATPWRPRRATATAPAAAAPPPPPSADSAAWGPPLGAGTAQAAAAPASRGVWARGSAAVKSGAPAQTTAPRQGHRGGNAKQRTPRDNAWGGGWGR